MKVTDDELITKSPDFLLASIEAAMTDPFHNMKVSENITTPRNKIQKLSQVCFETFTEDNDLLLWKSRELVPKIGEVLKETSFRSLSSRQDMWCKVLELLHEEAWFKSWKVMYPPLELSVFSGFFGHIVMDIVTAIIKFENESNRNSSEKLLELTLTKEEEEVLYYVSGYIVFSLVNKYTRLLVNNAKHTDYSDVLQFLSSLRTQHSNIKANCFHNYVKKWTEIQSRGGLIQVNYSMFVFVKRIEYAVRSILNINLISLYQGEDLRELIENKLLDNDSVNQNWDSITRDLPNEQLKVVLFQEIIRKWIDIRANSFVNTYVQILKQKIKNEGRKISISGASEPALRKTLNN